MKIIGVSASKFKGDNGQMVSGYNVYLTYPLTSGDGVGAMRVYVTEAKLSSWDYFPTVGDEVQLSYNRYGKVAEMIEVRQ